MAESMESINVMRFQEATSYRTTDYLRTREQPCDGGSSSSSSKDRHLYDDRNASSGMSLQGEACAAGGKMTEKWRERMCEWCYRVVDHYKLSRSIVAIAMNYLDRFLMQTVDSIDKKTFQLVTMAALFTAIKLNETRQLSMQSMVDLAQGCFTVQQLAEMELFLLDHLSWSMHPPTAHDFAHKFLLSLPAFSSLSNQLLFKISQVAGFWMELSIVDYYFTARHLPSQVALAALINAVEDLAPTHMETCCLRLQSYMQSEQSVYECRQRLRLLWDGSTTGDNLNYHGEPKGRASPVCVSFGTTNSFYQDH